MLHLAKLTEISNTPMIVAEINQSYHGIATYIEDMFSYLLATDGSAREAVIATVEDLQDFVQESNAFRSKKTLAFVHGELVLPEQACTYDAETGKAEAMTDADFVLYFPHQLSIFCIEVGLIEYAIYHLLINGLQVHKTATETEQRDKLPLLFYMLTQYHIPTTWATKFNSSVVNLLLKNSADPSEKLWQS